MATAVALLRGINLGPKRRVAMAELRTVFEGAGCSQVATYIQSGNVVLTHPRAGSDALRADLERRLASTFGFEIPLVVRTAAEWAALMEANPFPGAGGTELHVTFLREPPPQDAVDAIERDAFLPEEFAVVGRDVYLHLPGGMGRSTLAGSLDGLGSPATTRNWRTVTRLAAMLG